MNCTLFVSFASKQSKDDTTDINMMALNQDLSALCTSYDASVSLRKSATNFYWGKRSSDVSN